MLNGSRYWANSCVVLKSGKKYFVEESESQIKKKFNTNKEMIELNTAGIYSSKIHVRRNDISTFKSYSFL